MFAGLFRGSLTDGDAESGKFRRQLQERGFVDAELNLRVATLPSSRDLEDQLVADGHSAILRQVLVERGDVKAVNYSEAELLKRLKAHKTEYVHGLAERVAQDRTLAESMPAPLLEIVKWLQTSKP